MHADIIIVGGGAAGLIAGVELARGGRQVMILEHRDKIGKKLLATGSGRCNFTNLYQSEECYRGENPAFAHKIIHKCSAQKTIDFFRELGVYPKSKNGYVYPHTELAATMLDQLRIELQHHRVKMKCLEHVVQVEKLKEGFLVRTETYEYTCKNVLLSAGGKSYEVLGSDGSGFALAKKLGHTIVPPVPGLVPLISDKKEFNILAGIRTEGRVRLIINNEWVDEALGEVQLTAYGISGIPVFQISRYATKALSEKKEVHVIIDFLPELSEAEFKKDLEVQMAGKRYKSILQILGGWLHPNLIKAILMRLEINPESKISENEGEFAESITNAIKNFKVLINDSNGFESAQVTAGGVSTDEVHGDTMESKLVSGLYFAGEILDIDGICGGYNLQWAWSTGRLAAAAIMKEGKEDGTK